MALYAFGMMFFSLSEVKKIRNPRLVFTFWNGCINRSSCIFAPIIGKMLKLIIQFIQNMEIQLM